MKEIGALYGKALYELAIEEKAEERVLVDLDRISKALEDSPDYLRLMESHSISKQEKASLLDEAFGSSVDLITLNVIKLLMEKNAFRTYKDCISVFKESFNKANNIAEAKIFSAVKLKEEQADNLIQAITLKIEKKIVPHFIVDNTLRGGIRIEVDGVCYDNTISTKIDRISRLLNRD